MHYMAKFDMVAFKEICEIFGSLGKKCPVT